MSTRGDTRIGCADFRRSLKMDRRSFVKAGVLGTAGLSLSDLLRHEARGNAAEARPHRHHPVDARRAQPHRHVGPEARRPGRVSRRVRRHASTNVPGIRLSDLLPMCGKIMDKWSIIRSLHHHDAGHSTGDQICFTGYNSGPNPDENVHPSCGSIVSKQLGHLHAAPAAYVMIPRMLPGHRLGLPGRGAQAVRDQRRPGQRRPVPACRTSQLPDGHHARAARRPPRAAGAASTSLRRDVDAGGPDRRAGPLPPAGLGHPDLARGPRRLRPRPASRRQVRERYGFMPRVRPRGGQPLRLPGLEPAHPARPPAGRGRRPAGDGRPALVGHAREGLRVAARSASCRAGTRPTRA